MRQSQYLGTEKVKPTWPVRWDSRQDQGLQTKQKNLLPAGSKSKVWKYVDCAYLSLHIMQTSKCRHTYTRISASEQAQMRQSICPYLVEFLHIKTFIKKHILHNGKKAHIEIQTINIETMFVACICQQLLQFNSLCTKRRTILLIISPHMILVTIPSVPARYHTNPLFINGYLTLSVPWWFFLLL